MTRKITNTRENGEVTGYNPDANGDYYKSTDKDNDVNYQHDLVTDILRQISGAVDTDCLILYGGEVTDGGGGTVDIAACAVLSKDADDERKLVVIPAQTGVSLPSGWNDNRQIWVIARHDFKLGSDTRSHKITGETYHYNLLDSFEGESDSDDFFVDSDPNSVADTDVCLGSFQMNVAVFTDLSSGERTDELALAPSGGIETDTVAEKTSGTGVTIDGVLVKDNDVEADEVRTDEVRTDSIIEKTTDNGVTIEDLNIKDGDIGAYTKILRRLIVSEWTERSNPKNFNSYGITWSSDLSLFCAVGEADGTDGYLITSPDGVTWTERSNPKNLDLRSVTWSSDLSLFCAVGEGDGTDGYLITSPDGVTWTERSNPKNSTLYGITWSSDLSLFCAAGLADGTDGYLVTSPDGITWTERSNPKNFNLLDVIWSSDLSLFCAAGYPDGTDGYLVTSPDGITWTERSNPKNVRLYGITWSSDLSLFCAVGLADGTDGYLITSPDGITWTERSNPKNLTLNGITWSSDLSLFCTVGYADGTDAYLISTII